MSVFERLNASMTDYPESLDEYFKYLLIMADVGAGGPAGMLESWRSWRYCVVRIVITKSMIKDWNVLMIF